MQIFNLFPTALGIYNLDRGFTDKELSFVKSQETTYNTGNTTSTNHLVLEDTELKDLRAFVQDSIQQYFETVYAPSQNVSLRITQSWCNYTEPQQFHHKHSHPNSFISGVLYLQANEQTDKIYFYKNDCSQLKTPTENFNPYNSDSWWMEAKTGKMFIFPSHLTHMVETVQGNNTRISLSFNTFPVGNFGDDSSLTGLHL
jgi:uncharacterized protein (TIGR02466 family)